MATATPIALPALARALLRASSRRRRMVGCVTNEGWEILLDLYLSTTTRRLIGVRSACLVTGQPMTTAMAELDRLEASGMVRRLAPRQPDLRRRYVRLTRLGKRQVVACLAVIAEEMAHHG